VTSMVIKQDLQRASEIIAAQEGHGPDPLPGNLREWLAVHKGICPSCDGVKVVIDRFTKGSSTCPTCRGKGRVTVDRHIPSVV